MIESGMLLLYYAFRPQIRNALRHILNFKCIYIQVETEGIIHTVSTVSKQV